MTAWRELPKVELHCHLLGVIRPALLESIRRESGPILVTPEALAGAYPVCGLPVFQQWLEILRPYQCANAEAMRPILAAHVSDLIAQRVVYAEIMLSPSMFPRERGAMLDAFHRWRAWTFELEQGKIQIEFLLVVPRTLDAGRLEHDQAMCLELRREGLIVGVALVGVETGESIARFTQAFHAWRDAGLGIEIHAGEHSESGSVRDAIENGHPHRLGHGLSAFHDLALLDSIRANQIHIEFCPTSNLCTGAVASIGQHPIGMAKTQGLSFSLNTDDPGTFDCSMESEYETVAQAFGFGPADFMEVFRQSLAARFEPRLRYLASVPSIKNPRKQIPAINETH